MPTEWRDSPYKPFDPAEYGSEFKDNPYEDQQIEAARLARRARQDRNQAIAFVVVALLVILLVILYAALGGDSSACSPMPYEGCR